MYEKKIHGQYIAIGADPWADTAPEPTPTPAPASSSLMDSIGSIFGSVGGTVSNFGGQVGSAGSTVVTGGTPQKPSTLSQVGAGIGAFLKGLGTPMTPAPAAVPLARPGMSTGTKLAIAGGGALLLVLLLTRD